MKHLAVTFLMLILLMTSGLLSAAAEEPAACEDFIYGYSELGRELRCYAIGPQDAPHSMLIVFCVHGFEGSYRRDGEVLRLIAHQIIDHYTDHPEELQGFRLYIVPCANPDGLQEGYTQCGFGRCNANGIDVNRDFPIGWEERTSARNKTGAEPFSTAEARAIRDLVEQISPTYAMDVHGWINVVYGEGRMAYTFARPFDHEVKPAHTGGMLYGWLNSVCQEAILLELPAKPNAKGYVRRNAARLIKGLDDWFSTCSSK